MKIIGLLVGAVFLYQGVDSLVRSLLGEGHFDISGMTTAVAGLYLIHKALSSTTEPTQLGPKKSSVSGKNDDLSSQLVHTSDPSLKEVNRLIDEGKIMDAIRRYRSETGHNLKECKAYIDNYVKQKEGTRSS